MLGQTILASLWRREINKYNNYVTVTVYVTLVEEETRLDCLVNQGIESVIQSWHDDGPTSTTLTRHYASIGAVFSVHGLWNQ